MAGKALGDLAAFARLHLAVQDSHGCTGVAELAGYGVEVVDPRCQDQDVGAVVVGCEYITGDLVESLLVGDEVSEPLGWPAG